MLMVTAKALMLAGLHSGQERMEKAKTDGDERQCPCAYDGTSYARRLRHLERR